MCSRIRWRASPKLRERTWSRTLATAENECAAELEDPPNQQHNENAQTNLKNSWGPDIGSPLLLRHRRLCWVAAAFSILRFGPPCVSGERPLWLVDSQVATAHAMAFSGHFPREEPKRLSTVPARSLSKAFSAPPATVGAIS